MPSLMNYKVTLRYDGTRYHGWQRQPQHKEQSAREGKSEGTIQGKLENLLSRICNEKIEIDGSGRTDAGVHANGQVFNFRSTCGIKPDELKKQMNRFLPEDIVVRKVEEVPERFHSRLLVKEKTYIYRIWNSDVPPVFERKYVYQMEETLDIEAMKKAAEYMVGQQDYLAFSSLKKTSDKKSAKGRKSTVRNVKFIEFDRIGEELRITYTGDGFLYHMVRIMTGTLIEVGRHQRTVESIPLVIASKDREQAGYLVPAKGLCLESVKY